jgi:hypothetical protein
MRRYGLRYPNGAISFVRHDYMVESDAGERWTLARFRRRNARAWNAESSKYIVAPNGVRVLDVHFLSHKQGIYPLGAWLSTHASSRETAAQSVESGQAVRMSHFINMVTDRSSRFRDDKRAGIDPEKAEGVMDTQLLELVAFWLHVLCTSASGASASGSVGGAALRATADAYLLPMKFVETLCNDKSRPTVEVIAPQQREQVESFASRAAAQTAATVAAAAAG